MQNSKSFYIFCSLGCVHELVDHYGETHVAIIRNFLSDQLWAEFGTLPNVQIYFGSLGFETSSEEAALAVTLKLAQLNSVLGERYAKTKLHHGLSSEYYCSLPLQIGVSTESFSHAGIVSDFAGTNPLSLVPDYTRDIGPNSVAHVGFGCSVALSEAAFHSFNAEQKNLLQDADETTSFVLTKEMGPPEKIYRAFVIPN